MLLSIQLGIMLKRFYCGVCFYDCCADTNVVYGCVIDMEDNLMNISTGGFDRDEYIEHPERYASTFSKKVPLRPLNPKHHCAKRHCTSLTFISTTQKLYQESSSH